jgi:hypothetical protein
MADPVTLHPKWESVTSVCVIEDAVPNPSVFELLCEALSKAAVDSELIIVANGVSSDAAQELQRIAESVPDVTVHFLARRADRDTATLIGIDHALGDWVVVLSPTVEEITHLSVIFERAGPFEVVFAGARSPSEIPRYYRGLARLYFRLYQIASGATIDWPAPRVRVYSRAAARYLANQLDGEFMLRSLDFCGAFPGTRELVRGFPPSDLVLPSPLSAVRKAARGLLSTSAVPLRGTILIALGTGVLALMSSLYTVVSYLSKPEIAPGWTTLSLQISVMMFLFSIMFAMIAEYVLGVYRSTPPRRRIGTIREIRSPLRRQSQRLNVIGTNGQFQLGAPQSSKSAVPASLCDGD